MVNSCCVVGCSTRYSKGSGNRFFKFPINKNAFWKWIIALRRKNWMPSPYSVVCGKHFQTGQPSPDEAHPDFVPNVFSYSFKDSMKLRSAEKCEIHEKSYERILLEKKIALAKKRKKGGKGEIQALLSQRASLSGISKTVQEENRASVAQSTTSSPNISRIIKEENAVTVDQSASSSNITRIIQEAAESQSLSVPLLSCNLEPTESHETEESETLPLSPLPSSLLQTRPHVVHIQTKQTIDTTATSQEYSTPAIQNFMQKKRKLSVLEEDNYVSKLVVIQGKILNELKKTNKFLLENNKTLREIANTLKATKDISEKQISLLSVLCNAVQKKLEE